MYSGPLYVHVQGPGGASHPRVPFLVKQGRALLSILAQRPGAGETTLSSFYTDDVGNTVKATLNPFVRKLFLQVHPAPEEEREAAPEQVDRELREEWVEVNRDTVFSDEYVRGYGVERFARVTYETPNGEYVRFLFEDRDRTPDPEDVGGPVPDVEWTETERKTGSTYYKTSLDAEAEQNEDDKLEIITRVIFEVTLDDGSVRRVGFSYAEDDTVLAPPTVDSAWTEYLRTTEFLLIDGEIKALRTVAVTFRQFVFEPGRVTRKYLRLRYEEATEDFEYPSNITITPRPGGEGDQ